MSHNYAYGDEISFLHLAEALPQSTQAGMAIWTLPWSNIEHLTSTVYNITLCDDVWRFPQRLFRPLSNKRECTRTVDFRKLRLTIPGADVDGIVRRAKRMGWLYLHAPSDALRSVTTIVGRLRDFVAIIRLLAQSRAFKHLPGDPCPDGPMFFGELTQESFDQAIPVGKSVRNGVILLDDLPGEIRDQLHFDVETYGDFWDKRAKERNAKQGKHAKAVSLSAVDDLNLSKLLAVCDALRQYSNLLETIWNWLMSRRVRPMKTRKHMDANYSYKPPRSAKTIRRTFQTQVFQSNQQNWLAAGLIIDNDGTLALPVYSHKDLVYRTVWDLLNRDAIKTFINHIHFCNGIFLAFLIALRSQELTALPFEPLKPNDGGTSSHDYIVGREFKTNDQLNGITRDWPLPRAATNLVVGTQELLRLQARVRGTDIPEFLFDLAQNISLPFGKMLTREVGYTGPTDNLLKRMRPSSAQWVADISRSPLAVRTVLGHATLEESFGYIHGRPDDEYRDMVEQSKRVRDREIGKEMIAAVGGKGATEWMTRGVIKMGVDQIVALKLGDAVTAERARDLQAKIDMIKPAHFSEIYELIGEDRWRIDEFIGEGIAQPRPYQFCTAKKGGVHFSGACSTSANTTNPKNCKPYCPYNFETFASLELRADWVEKELSRGHFDGIEVNTEDPIFYNSAMKILDWVWSFQGPLARFKSDVRLLNVMERLAHDVDLVRLFKGEARRTLEELGVL